jgi:PAS domain S-box-containing protein
VDSRGRSTGGDPCAWPEACLETPADPSLYRGREVSCRAFAVLFEELDRRGLDPHALCAGTGVALSLLRDPSSRVSWPTFLRLMDNASSLWSERELFDIGRGVPGATFERDHGVAMSVLGSPTELYAAAAHPGVGIATRFVSCCRTRMEQRDRRRLQLELRMDPGYESSPPLLHLIGGGLAALPRFVGLPEARVEMQLLDDGALYAIELPRRGRAWARLRRAVTQPFAARRVARDLLVAIRQLDQRYQELAAATEGRRRAEQGHRESDERFRAVFHASPVAMIVSSSELRVLDANPSYLEMTGLRLEEVKGRVAVELLAALNVEPSPEHWAAIASRVEREGGLRDMDVRFERLGGETRFGVVSAEPVEIEGEPSVVWYVQDVSRLKRVEEMLRESEQTYFALYENAPDIYVEVDVATGAILRCNRKGSEILGIPKQQLMGELFHRIFVPEDAERARCAIALVAERGTARHVRLRARRRTGTDFEVSLTASAARDADRKVRYARVILHDISRIPPQVDAG